MSPERIAAVKARDQRDVNVLVPETPSWFARIVKAVVAKIDRWFGR